MDSGGERHEVLPLELLQRRSHARQRQVRILNRAAVTGVVLGARQDAVFLAALHPGRGLRADGRGVGPEGARLDDRVPGLQVQVADRGERPVDAHGAGFHPGDGTRGARGLDLRERAERRRRGQLGEPGDLLGGSALQVRADQQWAAGAAP